MIQEFDYKRYLASREWEVRREAVRARSQDWCERCLLLPMAATHHLTYEHIGAEPLEDLQGVCDLCHAFLSAKGDFDPLDWRDRLMAVCLEPAAEFHQYVALAVELGNAVGARRAHEVGDFVAQSIASVRGRRPDSLIDPDMQLVVAMLAVGPHP